MAQTPAEVAEKICQNYVARSNFEFSEQPVDAIQQGILIISPNVSSGESVKIETMITVHEIGRRFIALSASQGEIKLWFNDQLIFEGKTHLTGVPPAVSELKFKSEFSDLLSSFPGDYPIRIEFISANDNPAVFLWMKNENGQTQQNVDFRSDWNSFEKHPYRFRTSDKEEWNYPSQIVAMKHESPRNMNDWRYSTGMALDAIWQSGKHFQLPEYSDFVTRHLDFFINSFDRVRNEPSGQLLMEPPFYRYFRYQQLDDFGPQLLPFLYGPGNEEYKSMVTKGLNRIMYKANRLPDGMLVRSVSQSSEIRAEDLYMGAVLLCRAYAALGSRKYLEEAIKQVILYNSKLKERYTGLYRHGVFEGKTNDIVVAKWARANALMMMAKIELMKVIPENHPERASILRLLQKHAESVREQQSLDGRWHQVLDNETTYLETSSSAMFVYAFAEGITNGWFYNKEEFKRSAVSGWLAVIGQVDTEGNLNGTTSESSILPTEQDYQQLERIDNDPLGIGAILYAAVAISKLNQN